MPGLGVMVSKLSPVCSPEPLCGGLDISLLQTHLTLSKDVFSKRSWSKNQYQRLFRGFLRWFQILLPSSSEPVWSLIETSTSHAHSPILSVYAVTWESERSWHPNADMLGRR